MTLDPYKELGVAHDATDAEVKAAYHAAAKKTHPDANPDTDDAAEKFDRVYRSQLILLDPQKRSRYDRTGTVDDDSPDNMRTNALQIIDNFIETKVADFINSNFDLSKDPRRCDLLGQFRETINHEISNLTLTMMQMERSLKFLEDMGKRFSGRDAARPIERGFENRLKRVKAQIEDTKIYIEIRRQSLVIVSTYDFKFDPPASFGHVVFRVG